MDSQHRHDLKENDLEQFLANFGDWRKKHGSSTLLTVAAVLLVIVGYNLYGNIQGAAHENAWADLAGTTMPESYRRVAEDHSNPTVALLAQLRGADAYLLSALQPPADDEDFDKGQALVSAQAMYEQVLGQTDERIFRINAIQGLAAVAASQGDFAAARTHYEEAIALAKDDYAALSARAAQRLAMLDDLAKPVTFAPPSADDDVVENVIDSLELPNLESPVSP